MRSVIEAFEPVRRADGFGGASVLWESRGRWHAERAKLSGGMSYEAAEAFADYSARYLVRDAHPIKTGWRIKGDDGLLYDVVVAPNRARGLLELNCTRVNL